MYYRSSRSVAGKFPSHCFHSSPRCLNKVLPQPAPAKPAESSKGKNGARPGGPSIHSERPQEATCLLREYITKAIRDTAISAGKGTGGTTAVNHAMLSGVDGQLDRAASHERMETFKEEAEEQGVSSRTFLSVELHISLPLQICSCQGLGRTLLAR